MLNAKKVAPILAFLPVMRHKSELGVTLNNVVSCYPGVAPMEHVTLPTMKLTQLAVDRIGKPAVGRLEYFDSQLPGFGLRVADTGHKSWVVMYRVAGKLQRYTIDTLARLPKVEDARDKARAIMQEAARGGDPAAAKKASKIEARVAIPQDPDTVRAVAARFVEGYCRPKNRSWAETERTLRNHVVARWGDRELVSITRRDILDLLDDLVDRGHPIAANRVLAAARKAASKDYRSLPVGTPVTLHPGRSARGPTAWASQNRTSKWRWHRCSPAERSWWRITAGRATCVSA